MVPVLLDQTLHLACWPVVREVKGAAEIVETGGMDKDKLQHHRALHLLCRAVLPL